MARLKERLPVVYNYFRQHPDKFNEFFKVTGDKAYKTWLEFYEDILYKHIQSPDLRFGQHLFNEGIVPDSQYHTKEVDWLIDKGYVAAESILLWGTYGPNANTTRAKWEAAKPKLNAPLTAVETVLGWTGLKNYELYAKRFSLWSAQEPKPEYKILRTLDTDHIKAILLTQNLTPIYRDTFQKLLKQRETPVESFEISDVEIDCAPDE